MKFLLSGDEHELVVELMNIGIGRAADALSKMVQDEVLLSVPDLQFLHPTEASGSFCHYMPSALAGVMQDFSGFMSGRAALLSGQDRERFLSS
ncbi:MAG: chemotaxis protein CheC [Oceanisphaera sp.]